MDASVAGSGAAVALAEQDSRALNPAGLDARFAAPGWTETPNVVPMSKAFPLQVPPADNGVTGVIDRIRADYSNFRHQLDRQADPSAVDLSGKEPAQQLSDTMNLALKTQIDVLELGVTLNAGLTAAQQSQSSVKTLLEKS